MTTVKLRVDQSGMVYSPSGSLDLFLILSCLTSNLLVLGLFHLAYFCFLWGTNTSIFARLNTCPPSHIHNFLIILSRVYNEPIQRPTPSLLVDLIGKALHRYHRGQGFESRTSLNFFFRLSFRNCKSCIYNYNDHPSFKPPSLLSGSIVNRVRY